MAKFAPLPPETDIIDAILASPAWCRVGITMPDIRMRERAATELARSIVETMTAPSTIDQEQLPLAL
jgi:hypothetical protein